MRRVLIISGALLLAASCSGTDVRSTGANSPGTGPSDPAGSLGTSGSSNGTNGTNGSTPTSGGAVGTSPSGYPLVEGVTRPATANLADRTYPDAFASLVALLEQQYAFTEWKAVDFVELSETYASRFADAQTRNDEKAYVESLLQFLHDIPDGHVSASNDGTTNAIADLRRERVGGSLGFTVAALDDRTIVVDAVTAGGPADVAGVRAGARVDQVDGVAAGVALSRTPTIWIPSSGATDEDLLVAQLTYLPRTPVGTEVAVELSNPGEASRTVRLRAFDDGTGGSPPFTFNRPRPYGAADLTGDAVTSKVLPDGYGYLQLKAMFDPAAMTTGDADRARAELAEQIDAAFAAFKTANVAGVVVDVRFNAGGFDALGASTPGHWTDARYFYEYATAYDAGRGTQVIDTTQTLWTERQATHYDGPVVLLANTGTIGSGEGAALQTNKMAPATAKTMGFWGTNGSFGITGGGAVMPGGITVSFPLGRSLDTDERIQDDGDARRVGGQAPKLRVPRTLENILAVGRGEDPELAAALSQLRSMN